MIDSSSLMLLTAVAALMVVLVLGSLARIAIAGIRYWLAANLLLIAAVGLFSLHGRIPPTISIVLSNACLLASTTALLVGYRRFFGASVPAWLLGALAGGALVAMTLFYAAWNLPNARIAVGSAYSALMCTAIAVTAWQHRRRTRSAYTYHFLLTVATLCALAHAARGLIYASGMTDLTVLDASAWNLAFLILGILGMPSLTLGAVLLIHDRMLTETERLSSHDFLTGLSTRRPFFDEAQRAMRLAQRQGTPLTMMMLDLDRFKELNDRHGHAAGDTALREFGEALRRSVRPSDCVARLGGEEFAVLYVDATLEQARAYGNGLRQTLTELPLSIRFTFSAGLASWLPPESIDRLLARADKALYAAKQGGRDRIEMVIERRERRQA